MPYLGLQGAWGYGICAGSYTPSLPGPRSLDHQRRCQASVPAVIGFHLCLEDGQIIVLEDRSVWEIDVVVLYC